MADLFELDGLIFNGYPNDYESFDVASSVSPYRVADEFGSEPGERRYTWTDSAYSVGASQVGPSPQNNVERTIPLQIRNRFSAAFTNLVTNPRPYSVVTGWQAEGTGSTVTYNTVATENVIQAVTTGSANSGMETSFTGTVASYSAGVWVKISTGTAACVVKFDGESGTAFTATTSWQFVKTEGVTLTAATRYLQILQTDTGSRTIYVKLAGVVLNSTYPGYIDGACGDAVWNGTAHASTSTNKTGEDAILSAHGLIGEKGEKVNYKAKQGGQTLYWQADGATYRTAIDCRAIDITSLTYDRPHAVADGSGKRIGRCEVTMICDPRHKGPEYTAGTFYKASGVPALTCNITDVKGHVRGPARVKITGGTAYDQRHAIYGIQGRDYVSGSSLVIRGPEMGTAGYSGSIVAHTNEVQTITQSGTITAGSFALSLDAVSATAANAAYNVGTAALDTYIETIPNIGSGGVTVSGGPLPGTAGTITFGGTLAGCNVSPLVVDNTGLTGGSYTIATVTPGTAGYVTAGLYSTETTICDSGNLSLVGDYQMWARVYDNSSTSDLYKSRLRAKWAVGDGGVETNDWATPQAVGDFSLVDLGQLHIDEAVAGTQRTKVYIEGKTSGTAGSTVRVVDLMFYPLETGFGEVRSVETPFPSLVIQDDFGLVSGVMSGDTPRFGTGTYTKAGDTDDFSAGGSGVRRTAVSDTTSVGCFEQLAISHTGIDASVTVLPISSGTSPTGDGSGAVLGMSLRYVDSSNYVVVGFCPSLFGAASGYISTEFVRCKLFVGGSNVQTFNFSGNDTSYERWYYSAPRTIRCSIDAAGVVQVFIDGERVITGQSSYLATGGALATGASIGLYDEWAWGSAFTREYRNLKASKLTGSQPAVSTSRDLQFRSNEIVRADSTGTVYGTPFQNSQPFQPDLTPEGSEGLTNRLLIGTSRNNPDLASHPHPDAFTATILHTPVYVLGRDEE